LTIKVVILNHVFSLFQSNNSTGQTLQLLNVDFVNSGAYSCEVIVDTTFHTLIETKKMLVIRKSFIFISFLTALRLKANSRPKEKGSGKLKKL
jgi:hypothetical protein